MNCNVMTIVMTKNKDGIPQHRDHVTVSNFHKMASLHVCSIIKFTQK